MNFLLIHRLALLALSQRVKIIVAGPTLDPTTIYIRLGRSQHTHTLALTID